MASKAHLCDFSSGAFVLCHTTLSWQLLRQCVSIRQGTNENTYSSTNLQLDDPRSQPLHFKLWSACFASALDSRLNAGDLMCPCICYVQGTNMNMRIPPNPFAGNVHSSILLFS